MRIMIHSDFCHVIFSATGLHLWRIDGGNRINCSPKNLNDEILS
jgi:hypothetical protein